MSNEEMVRYWNEAAGPVWVAHQERLDTQLAQLGAVARERAAIRAGERVLDVGCGCGGTTIDLASEVGAGGGVVAVDLSQPMLDRARERAQRAGLVDRIAFVRDDAQTASFEAGAFDVLFSRFGVMFFDDPVAAFANLRRALRPGGRFSFVCWQRREKNPWMVAPAAAAAQHLTFPPPPAPDAPGPFAFGDADRVLGILEAAGFAGANAEPFEQPMRLGGDTLDDALELCLAVGPVGAALREAKPSDEQRARVVEAVRSVLERFSTPRGFEAPAAAWLFTAMRE